MSKTDGQDSQLVDFLAKFTASEQFNEVFAEGMGLVEETANYLDGPGRLDARALDRQGSITYATESMRLTTRLMQLASWLLLQRAISSGELSREAAIEEKKRINLSEAGPGHALPGAASIPDSLKDLIARSLHVHARIMQLDKMIGDKTAPAGATDNPVASQMNRLTKAFGTRSG